MPEYKILGYDTSNDKDRLVVVLGAKQYGRTYVSKVLYDEEAKRYLTGE